MGRRKPSAKNKLVTVGSPVRPNVLVACLLFILAVSLYAPSWKGEFLWDDANAITQSTLIKDPEGWWKIWISPPASHPDYFPLTTSSFWLEWRLFGENPVGYRVTNTLLHGVSVVLLYLLLLQLGLPGAAWAAAIFAVHPVNVESVAWISERKNMLAMALALASFLFYVKWLSRRHRPAYRLALFFFVAALAAKASVVALPLLFLAYLWWRDRAVTNASLRELLPFLAASFVFGLLVVFFQHTRAVGAWEIPMPDFISRVAIAGWAYWHYLITTVWPFDLATIYPRPPSGAALNIFFPITAATAILGAWAFLSKNGALRTAGFALVAAALLLAPVLGFIKMSFMRYALVSDHLQHVMVPLLVSVVVCGLSALLMSVRTAWVRRALAIPALAAVLVGFFVAGWQRAGLHASNEALWQDSLAKNPNSGAAHNFLGSILASRGDFEKAATHFFAATKLEPTDTEFLSNYGYSLVDTGRIQDAVSAFRKAIDSGSPYPGSYLGLAEIFATQGDQNAAIEVLTTGARRFPNGMTLNAAAAAALMFAGQPAAAIPFLERCRQLDPANPKVYADLGEAKRQAGVPHREQPGPP